MEHVVLHRFLCKASEEFKCELVGNLKRMDKNGVAEMLKHVLRLHWTVLINGKILSLKLFLTLVILRLQFSVSLFHQRSINVIVGHGQCHNLAEFPISRTVGTMIITNLISLRETLYALIDRQEYSQVSHSVSYICNVANGVRKPRTNLKQVGLRGPENGNRTPWFVPVVVEVRVMICAVVVETESLAQFLDANVPTVWCSIYGEIVYIHVLHHRWREELLQAPYTRIIVGMVGDIVF